MDTRDGIFDLLIIGGGINGAGIARDAAGRGLRVLLVEEHDLASGTSSASSKLVHGGLRYLEQGQFRLVREALAEREVLIRIAPHLVAPLRFVLPHDAGMRPAWTIRAGLFLYDHLAKRSTLPASAALDLGRDPAGAPLKPRFERAFAYWDARVDDSRLVVANALDAARRGAAIRTRCRFTAATDEGGTWSATIEREGGAGPQTVRARAVVNAAGPWVQSVLEGALHRPGSKRVRHVKGSHVVLPRLYVGDHAYILQNTDRRVVFLIPYEDEFTLVGTTDTPVEGDPRAAAIDAEETGYLCAAASRFLRRSVRPEKIAWSYSGVRALFDDGEADPSAITRDYSLDLDAGAGGAPVLSVFGGKLTTYRRLAEHALETLTPVFPGLKGPWTARAPLPGGDLPGGGPQKLLAEAEAEWPWLPPASTRRLARSYGTRVHELLAGARGRSDLGEDLGAGLTERELSFLVETEWASTAQDVLWRRSKLGLHGGPALEARVASRLAGSPVATPDPRPASAAAR